LQYALFQLEEARLLRRYGIRPEIMAAKINIPAQQLGYSMASEWHAHEAFSFLLFRAMMERFIKPDEDDVFIDYGSGTGSALVMAATFPFRRIIGVEYSKTLHAMAQETVRKVGDRLACKNFELINMDAALYTLPDDVTVVYLFNPFDGETLSRVCEQIRKSLERSPRRLKIANTAAAKFDRLVEGQGWVKKQVEWEFPLILVNGKAAFYQCG
jgi:hypothetical protein